MICSRTMTLPGALNKKALKRVICSFFYWLICNYQNYFGFVLLVHQILVCCSKWKDLIFSWVAIKLWLYCFFWYNLYSTAWIAISYILALILTCQGLCFYYTNQYLLLFTYTECLQLSSITVWCCILNFDRFAYCLRCFNI